jgi:hypothetical protein
MTLRLICTLLLCCGTSFWTTAQLDRTHIQGAASPYALSSDYRALGFNPALLTFAGWSGGYDKVTGGFEGGLSLRSNLLDKQTMWDQLLGRESAEGQDWTTETWLNALTDEELEFSMSFLTAAYARRFGKWGIAYANRRGVSANVTLSSKTAKLFTDGGLDLYSEIELVQSGEVVSVEDYDFNLGDLWEGVTVAGDATLANLLEETSLRYQSMRTHELGLSRGWGDVGNGWSLHTGVGARVLLGTAYFDVHTEEGSVVAFGSRSQGFSLQNFQNLDSLIGSTPSSEWVSVISPSGYGWGMDVGAVLARGDDVWVTASLVDMGRMTWEGEEYSVGDIDLTLTDFGSSTGAVDPDSWLSSAVDILDADTWFQTSESATRRVSNKPMLALGAGMRIAPPVLVAGNITVRNREALSNGGWSGGLSGGLRITNAWIVETGIQRATSDVWRFPVSTRISLENGWEIGFRAGDFSALWEGSQPELSMQTCFFRYRFVAP